MNELKFNSQICTTKIQSQRLLDLGLKPETADCFHWEYAEPKYIGTIDDEGLIETDVPAWSLHRLMEILNAPAVEFSISTLEEAYEDVIYNISESIKNGYFNKEYLKQ